MVKHLVSVFLETYEFIYVQTTRIEVVFNFTIICVDSLFWHKIVSKTYTLSLDDNNMVFFRMNFVAWNAFAD